LQRPLPELGVPDVPSASKITAILHRPHLIEAGESSKHRGFERFEHAAPNELWQMDFKGHFATASRPPTGYQAPDFQHQPLAGSWRKLLGLPLALLAMANTSSTTRFPDYSLFRSPTAESVP